MKQNKGQQYKTNSNNCHSVLSKKHTLEDLMTDVFSPLILKFVKKLKLSAQNSVHRWMGGFMIHFHSSEILIMAKTTKTKQKKKTPNQVTHKKLGIRMV